MMTEHHPDDWGMPLRRPSDWLATISYQHGPLQGRFVGQLRREGHQMSLRLDRAATAIVAMAVAVIAACGGKPDDEPGETAPTMGSTSPSAVTTTAPGGLEPRSALPDLVDGEAAACLPLCAQGRINDREIPAGTYQTLWFFGGAMTLDLEEPWALWEDSTGEFSLGPVEDPDYRLVLWLDVYPVVTGVRVEGVPSTAEGLLGWLQANPALVVSEPVDSAIGEVPATAVDVSISSAAVNDDPGCPAPVCQNFFGFPQWGEPFGIAGDDPYRLYFADVSYSGTDHVLVAAVEGRDPEHLAQFALVAEAVMATIEIPARPAG